MYLERLNIYGWPLVAEAAIMATIASRSNALLVGLSGNGKTSVVSRMCNAISNSYDMETKERNAATAAPEDIIGFAVPIPESSRNLEEGNLPVMTMYRSPDNLTETALLVLDEISRTSQLTSNKWYTLLNERQVDGFKFEKLQAIFSAMNPPDTHEGSSVIDPGMANRFMFIMNAPDFWDHDDQTKLRIINAHHDAVSLRIPLADVGKDIYQVIDEMRHSVKTNSPEPAVMYSITFADLLNKTLHAQDDVSKFNTRRVILLSLGLRYVKAFYDVVGIKITSEEVLAVAKMNMFHGITATVPFTEASIKTAHEQAFKKFVSTKDALMGELINLDIFKGTERVISDGRYHIYPDVYNDFLDAKVVETFSKSKLEFAKFAIRMSTHYAPLLMKIMNVKSLVYEKIHADFVQTLQAANNIVMVPTWETETVTHILKSIFKGSPEEKWGALLHARFGMHPSVKKAPDSKSAKLYQDLGLKEIVASINAYSLYLKEK